MTIAEKKTKEFCDTLTVEELNGIKKFGAFCAHWYCDLETIYNILYEVTKQEEG